MKLRLLTLLLITGGMVYAQSSTPVWSTDVAPILYNHCTACHHDNGIAPFSLLTYSEAVANSAAMSAAVSIRKMPPWEPDPSYSHFAHERILTQSDINAIVNWAGGGTPQGDASLAPPVPTYSTHGMISGTPDLVVKIPTYTSTAATGDVYQCFVIPSGLLTDKYITSFEAVPGNPACVHHVLVYADTTGICAHLDSASPGPGYPDFGGVGSSSATMLGVWVPGSSPMSYPNGFGLRLPNHSDVVVQVHYPAGTVGMVDSTEVHFYFAPSAASIRQVYLEPLLYHEVPIIDSTLFIPANTVKTFTETLPAIFSFPDLTLLGVFPHMHLIGTTIKTYGIEPSGDTDHYIRINNWDFHWQGFYMLPQLKKIPAGTSLRSEAIYNNTSSNPENPHSPPTDVSAGENTTDEMMITFFSYAYYQPGDENIIVDSAVALNTPMQNADYYHGQQLLDVCPNPAVSDLVVKCYLDEPDKCTIDLVDMDGRVVRQYLKAGNVSGGYSAFTYSVRGLPSGSYTLRMVTSQRILSQKVIVQH
jgi:Copper type II ascorbate-dependent monooxygenase, N-terminal domain/Copper type II ascorbate-dependent monooxygenase, C-terminal domain